MGSTGSALRGAAPTAWCKSYAPAGPTIDVGATPRSREQLALEYRERSAWGHTCSAVQELCIGGSCPCVQFSAIGIRPCCGKPSASDNTGPCAWASAHSDLLELASPAQT